LQVTGDGGDGQRSICVLFSAFSAMVTISVCSYMIHEFLCFTAMHQTNVSGHNREYMTCEEKLDQISAENSKYVRGTSFVTLSNLLIHN